MEEPIIRIMTRTQELESALVSTLRYLPEDCVIVEDIKALLRRYGWEFKDLEKVA